MAPELGAVTGKAVMGRFDALLIMARWEWSTIWFFLLVWIVIAIACVYAFWVP